MHRAFIGAFSAAALVGTLLVNNVPAQADTGLPEPEFPLENPMLPDQDVLGKFLFWEEQVSSDNTMACGTCHIHEAGGEDPRALTSTNPHPGPDSLFGTGDDIRGSAGVVMQSNAYEFNANNLHFPKPRVTGRRSPACDQRDVQRPAVLGRPRDRHVHRSADRSARDPEQRVSGKPGRWPADVRRRDDPRRPDLERRRGQAPERPPRGPDVEPAPRDGQLPRDLSDVSRRCSRRSTATRRSRPSA
jgi:hypothetical protein